MTKTELLNLLKNSTLQHDPQKGNLYAKYFPLIDANLSFCPQDFDLSSAASLDKNFKNAEAFEIYIRRSNRKTIKEKFERILADLSTFAENYASQPTGKPGNSPAEKKIKTDIQNVAKGNETNGDNNVVGNAINIQNYNVFYDSEKLAALVLEKIGKDLYPQLRDAFVSQFKDSFKEAPERISDGDVSDNSDNLKDFVEKRIIPKAIIKSYLQPGKQGNDSLLDNMKVDGASFAQQMERSSNFEFEREQRWNKLSENYDYDIREQLGRLSESNFQINAKAGILDDEKLNLGKTGKLLLQAQSVLSRGEFEVAEKICEQLIALTEKNGSEQVFELAEAYMCKALAKCEIQLIRDYYAPDIDYQPILNDWGKANALETNEDYLRAVKLLKKTVQSGASEKFKADAEQKAEEYRKIVEAVETLLAELKGIEEEDDKTLNCDCFICAKSSQGTTGDHRYITAKNGLYKNLTDVGLRPFYSEITLSNYTKGDYRYNAAILYALSKAKCFVLVCENQEYIESPWVKNEWTWFRRLADKKNLDWTKRLMLVFNGKNVETMGYLLGCHSYQNWFDRSKTDAPISTLAERVKKQVNKAKKEDGGEENTKLNLSNDSFDIQNGVLVKFQGGETAVLIPNGVERIEENAFKSVLETLKTVTIPDSVKTVAANAFSGCRSLTSVDFGKGLISIGDGAFRDCIKLTSVSVPNGVTSIGFGAFQGCNKLRKMILPFVGGEKGGVSRMPFGYIFGAENHDDNFNVVPPSLKEVTVTGKTSISANAFNKCTRLTSINLGDGVIGIGEGAFCDCINLTSVTIPDSVTNIGFGAFKGCNKLASISIPFVGEKKDGSGSTFFGYIFGAKSADENKDFLPALLRTVTVTGKTSVDVDAFYGCDSLTSVTLEKNVTGINAWAFSGCSGLTVFTVPSGVKTVGAWAFSGCKNLTEIRCAAPRRPFGWSRKWADGCGTDGSGVTIKWNHASPAEQEVKPANEPVANPEAVSEANRDAVPESKPEVKARRRFGRKKNV